MVEWSISEYMYDLQAPLQLLKGHEFKTPTAEGEYWTRFLMLTRYKETHTGLVTGLTEDISEKIRNLPQEEHFPLNTIAEIEMVPSNTTRFQYEFHEIKTIKNVRNVHVCQATSNVDEKAYAIKKVAKKVGFNWITDKELCEIRYQAKLDHVNIVRYYEAWIECRDRLSFWEDDSEFDKHFFMTYEDQQGLAGNHIPILHIRMELCSGTLQSYTDERTKEYGQKGEPLIDEHVNRNMRIHLLSALEYIHSKTLIHRDIKPENIFTKMVNDGLVFLLGDFGLSCTHTVVDGEAESHEKGIGNDYYMAPEQRDSTQYDQKVDIYSLGLVFAETYFAFPTKEKKNRMLANLKRKGMKQESVATSWKNVEAVIKTNMVRFEPHLRSEATELLQLFNECVLKDEVEAKEKEEKKAAKKQQNSKNQ